jgi:hypothetical protein
MPLVRLALCFAAASALLRPLGAQTIQVEPHRSPLPAELSPAIAAGLGATGQIVTFGQTTLHFWWVSSLAPGQGPATAAAAWRNVPEGSLLGAVRVEGPFRDIRGRPIKAGVYTLRFALQPANGDHLGVSPNREFLIVAPAAADQDPGPAGHERSVDMGRGSIGSSHPGVLSLDPPYTDLGAGSIHVNEAGHEAFVCEIPRAGAPPLRFGLIVLGRIEA